MTGEVVETYLKFSAVAEMLVSPDEVILYFLYREPCIWMTAR